ncbi:MAG: hypothetical protein IJF97_00475 [Eggerthellaceae bacterium]|nr:hypothetical protein [Eggerthellaceae bacterium]
MAKRDDKDNQPTRRVYKSSDVHKRRVGDSSRSKPAKMPSRREVRESTRESTRIAAESRIERTAKSEPLTDDIVEDRSAVVGEESAETTRPRFTVIKGAESHTQDDQADVAHPDASSDTPSDETDPPAEKRPHRLTDDFPMGQRTSHEASVGPSSPGDDAQVAPNAEPSPGEENDEQDDGQAGEQDAGRPKRRVAVGAREAASHVRPKTVVIAAVLVVAVIAVALFAFNRWGRYDDHADLQGTWYVMGTDVPITIDAESIRFNEEVSYNYEINPREKTISYTFGPMAGQGRYWFSDDRKHLVITDGDGYTAAGTTVDDLIRAFLDFSTAAGGGVVEMPQGEGIIAFSRTPEVLVTNQPADGLYEQQSGESQSASSAAASEAAQPTEENAAAEQAEGDLAADQQGAGEESMTEGDYGADEVSDAGTFETATEESTNEEEAA